MSTTKTESAIFSDTTDHTEEIRFPAYIDTIFERLTAKDVEQFYSSYQLWLLQRRAGTLQTEIDILQQAVADNEELMQGIDISPITLANLAQLQAYGVNDVDLLDRMSERGEAWLDHTMQLLKYCEEMDVIRSNYTQWCEHSLNGAYNWIASIAAELETPTDLQVTSSEVQATTEEELLQKLMSDEGETDKMPALAHNFGKSTPKHDASVDPYDETTPEYVDEALVVDVTHATSTQDEIEEIASITAEDEVHVSGENNVAQEDMLDLHLPDEEMIVGEETSGEDIPNDESSNLIEQEGLNEDLTAPTDKFVVLTINHVNQPVEIENEQNGHHKDLTASTDKFAVLTINPANDPVEIEDEQDRLYDDLTATTDKFAVLTVNQVDEPIEIRDEQIAQEDNGTDSSNLEIDDANIAQEVQNSQPEQINTQPVIALKSSQENKKSSLQKVHHKGFWWFVRKLLLSILRR